MKTKSGAQSSSVKLKDEVTTSLSLYGMDILILVPLSYMQVSISPTFI
jgi:hypothetical protein